MAAFTTDHFSIPVSAPFTVSAYVRPKRRRITSRAGHALEILGHAIEYLTDEFYYEATSISTNTPKLEAVQLLMSLNRAVYYECPEIPNFSERWCSICAFARHNLLSGGQYRNQ